MFVDCTLERSLLIISLNIIFLVSVVRANNFTHKYLTMSGASSSRSFLHNKQNRIFSFSTDPDGEISIEIDFAIPFIKIPIKKAMDLGEKGMATFNVPALAIGSMIALVGGFVLPGVAKFLSYKAATKNRPETANDSQKDRGDDENSFEWWRIVNIVDQAFMENNIDTTACMQKGLCFFVQTPTSKNAIKILMTDGWIKKLLTGTPFEIAILKGIRKFDCDREFSSCTVDQKAIKHFVDQLKHTFA